MTTTSSLREPLVRTPDPTSVPGAWFDEEAVHRLIRFFGLLRHVKGRRWAGKPIEPIEFQVEHIFRPIFGWKHPDGTRIVRTAWIELPRKNLKTTTATGLGLYLVAADGEPGAEVYAGAGSKEQARFVFDPARKMVAAAPALRRRLRPLRDAIVYDKTASVLRVISSVAGLQHGGNVHGAVIDEVHVHRTRDLIDALETGTAAREQPLVIFITTAGEEGEGSIYAEKHDYTRRVAAGVIEDPSHYGVIYAAEREDDWREEATWEKANPAIDVGVSREYLRKEARKAEASPASLATFLRFHLGVRSRLSGLRYIDLERWDASKDRVPEADLRGRPCWGGIDLGRTQDVGALVWDFPGVEGHDVVWRFFVPEDTLTDLDVRTGGQASRWVEEGFLLATPGNIVDYDAITRQIVEDSEHFEVVEIAYHRRGMTQLAIDLGEDEGFVMVPVAQGMATLTPPTQELQRLVMRRGYRHGGHPVARWMIDNLAVRMDGEGSVRPDKDKSSDVITGVLAGVMALDRAIRHTATDEEEHYVEYHEDVSFGPDI